VIKYVVVVLEPKDLNKQSLYLRFTNQVFSCPSVTAIEYTAKEVDPSFSKYAPITCSAPLHNKKQSN